MFLANTYTYISFVTSYILKFRRSPKTMPDEVPKDAPQELYHLSDRVSGNKLYI